jgi:ACS family hexuronate transporter-like MFS transporter
MMAAESAAPSRKRWLVLSLISLAFIVNFVDRQILSLVAPLLRAELHLSNSEYGVIVFAFLLGMASFQIPNGLLMDRAGPRRGFSIIVSFWSVMSFLHAFARSTLQFSLLRFGLGSAECGNYTGGIKIISEQFPSRERALAGGIFNSCTFIGSVVAPLIVTHLTLRYSWHTAFMVASSVGALWVIPWLIFCPRRPLSTKTFVAETPSLPAGAGAAIRSLLGYKQTWGLIAYRALTGPLSHFYWFWLPAYLSSARGLTLRQIGVVVWLPYLFAGIGNIGSGYLSNWLQQHGAGVDRSRRVPLIIGALLCSVGNLTVFFAGDLTTVITLLCAANLGENMMEPVFMGYIGDFFAPQVVGRVTALTGVGDNLMSMLLMLATGIAVDRYSYLPVFIIAGVIPIGILVIVFRVLGSVRRLP